MRIPIGIDLTETWEVDLCEEAARYAVDLWKRVADGARAEIDKLVTSKAGEPTDEKRGELVARAAAADAAKLAAEKELAAYVPGTGPRFVLGHIPAAKRAEIAGMWSDADKPVSDREKLPAQHAWRREIVRWAVRGHSNLKTGRGVEVPFESEPVTIAGETLKLATDRQIERYAPFLADLANVAMAPQSLGESEKNA